MTRWTRRVALLAVASSTLGGARPAAAQTAIGFNLSDQGITWLGSNASVDFSTTPALGGWRLMGDRKYLSLQLVASSPGCYQIDTWAISDNRRTSDTHLWIRTGNLPWQSLNDDFDRSEHYSSRARLWLEQPPGQTGISVEVGVAAYSSANNSMSFGYNLWRVMAGTTPSSCDNGEDSFALFQQGTLTVIDRLGI